MALPRPILPAPGRPGDDRPPAAFTPPPKRQQTAVACEQCRKRKIKCDGGRPSCNNCSRKATTCEYAADAGVGRAGRNVARQEALEALERDKEVLQTQNRQWLELVNYIRTRSESEAWSIFLQLRQSQENDPAGVLQMVQTGDALASLQQPPVSRLEQINQEAFDSSTLRVQAQPWTSVAGDGIVSELISLFFEWEALFECPMIETSAFLNDMNSGDVRSFYCSPMLINAICALACFLCDRVRDLDGHSKGAMALKFWEAAEREHERNSKPSMTSVQALYLMFLYGVAIGQDKKYAKYRFTACSMVQTLNLERKYTATTEGHSAMQGGTLDTQGQKAQAISKGMWGLYCTETIIGIAYGQPSLISTPTIPQPSEQIFLQIQCELSRCLNDVMQYSRRTMSGVGESEDMATRMTLYNDLKAQVERLPVDNQQDRAVDATVYYLSELYNVSAIMVLRPLLACDTLAPVRDMADSKKTCIDHCSSIVGGWRRAEKSRGLEVSSLWQVLTPATCCFTLVTQLGKQVDSRIDELFVACCAMLRAQTDRWPLAVYWLQALHYFAQAINAREHIPPDALQYLQGLESLGMDISGDVPIGFIVPMQEELVELASDSDAPEVSIGKLIEKFNAASLSI